MKKWPFIVGAIVLVIVVVGGIFILVVSKEKTSAIAFIPKYFQAINNREYERIYNDYTDEVFKKTTPQKQYIGFMDGIETKLGLAKERKLINWNIQKGLSETICVLIYCREFQR